MASVKGRRTVVVSRSFWDAFVVGAAVFQALRRSTDCMRISADAADFLQCDEADAEC